MAALGKPVWAIDIQYFNPDFIQNSEIGVRPVDDVVVNQERSAVGERQAPPPLHVWVHGA